MAEESQAKYPHTKFSLGDYQMILVFAIIIDILSFIPAVGSVGVGIIRVIFWFKGIRHKHMTRNLIMGSVIELIPIISLLPATALFVTRTYAGVKEAEKLQRAKIRGRTRGIKKQEGIKRAKAIKRQQAGEKRAKQQGAEELGAGEVKRPKATREPGVGRKYGHKEGQDYPHLPKEGKPPIYNLNQKRFDDGGGRFAKGAPYVAGAPYAKPKKQKRGI